MEGDQKLVYTILERLCTRLPIRTGDDLSDVRRDEIVTLSRGTLLEISKTHVAIVMSTILQQLEAISRNYENLVPRSRPLLVLLSQTYLVELLADCTGSNWDAHDSLNREYKGQTENREPDVREFIPRRSRRRETDPPPLDDELAQYTMDTLLRLTNNNGLDDHVSIGSGKGGTGTAHSDERSLDGIPRKSTDLERASFKVIEYLSATNWSLVYQIMRTKLKYLRTTAAEEGDASGLQFISHLSLSQKKLSLVIQEISGSFLPLRKSSQNTLASLLPEAIHRWIDSHPNDFIDLHTTHQRLEGGADVLFDFATGLSDGTKRRAVIWPLQTALVLLLPEVFIQADMSNGGHRGNSLAKKLVFLNNLRQALKLPRSADIAASCLITICRAGSLFPSDSDSALLSFAFDIQNDMREEIFKKSIHGVPEDYGVDRDILIKAFVSLARLSVESVVEHLLPKCLDKNSPMSFKITVFAAAAVLASQPNHKQYQELFTAIAPEIREYLQTIAASRPLTGNAAIGLQLSSGEACMNRSTLRANISTDSIGSVELLYQLLELLKIRPYLIYENWDIWDSSDVQALECERDGAMFAILRLIYDEDEFIRNSTVVFARRLMTQESFDWLASTGILNQNDGLMSQLFWFTSSTMLFTLSQRLLDFDSRDPGLKSMLELLHGYLEARVNVIQSRRGTSAGDLTIGVSEMPERVNANISLEMSFLVLLCSPDLEICSMTTHAIALLCEEGRMIESPEDHQRSPLTLMRNFPVYSELSLQAFRITGPVAFQTRLRKLLTRMSHPSMGIIAAWETVFYRWKNLSHHVLSPGVAASGQIDDRIHMEWRNYSGFLASIGGVCIADVPSHMPTGARVADPVMAGAKWIDRFQPDGETMSLLERFMRQCLQLLVCKLVNVRENIRQVLGTELNPRLYLQLFRSLETELNVVLDPTKDGYAQIETRTLFTEQVCSLLKTIVDRLEETQDTFLSVDLGAMTLSLARYLETLKDDATTLRVKIRMCYLVEVVARKKKIVNLRHDMKIRNHLLQILSEWMSRSNKVESPYSTAQGYKRDEFIRLQRDLDRACLRAVVNLLDRLSLQPPEVAHDADMLDARSNMFSVYFNAFLALLDQGQSSIDNTRTADSQTASLARDDAESFRSLAIQALSNLLSANVDVGLKYSLEVGYHESLSTRTAFMQVLTNILTQGTEFGTLGDTAIGEKYEHLIDLLVNDVKFALALCDYCPSSEVDELTTALLNIFESRGQGLKLLKELIQQEVAKTENEADLLRRNCVATKMLSVYAKWQGSEYLYTVLHDILERLVTSSSDLDLEMDPKKGGLSDAELARNGEQLRHCAKAFIDEISNSAHIIPDSFKSICHCIKTCVMAKFPEAKYTAVGAFIFLRFFCPAIVSPDTEGLITSALTKEMRRGLMLIAKIIQGLANNVLFVAKESYMIPLNDFLTKNICQVIQFLRDISVPPEKPQPVAPHETFDFGSRVALHRFLFDHWETVRHKLLFEEKAKFQQANGSLSGSMMKSFSEMPTSEIEQSIQEISAVINSLGTPPLDISLGRPPMAGSIPASYSRYQQFMLKHSGRSVEGIMAQRIVYEGGETNDGLPVMCFVQRNINTDKIDGELLAYCFLKTLSRMMHKPFAILIDATMHGPQNELTEDVCLSIRNLMPPEMINNYRRMYIYNMNSAYKKFFRKTLKHMAKDDTPIVWGRGGVDIACISSVQELQQHFNLASIHLPKETMSFLSDSRYVFHNVTRLWRQSQRAPIDVTLKVGSQYIQITPTKGQELNPGFGLMVTVNDIFRLTDVEETSITTSFPDDENAFGLKVDNGKVAMFFSSPKKVEILKVLKASKAKLLKDATPSKKERTIRPEDVPGTMLNISLMNMGSTDPNLRLAAYNLLCAMCEAFSFSLDGQSVNARGLSIPPDAVTLIVGLSEKLATTEPHLTFDFLTEFFIGWDKSHTYQRAINIRYISPWLANLYTHVLMGADDTERHKERLVTIARKIIQITVQEPRLYTSFQQNVWSIIGKDEGLLDVFLEELIKAAMNFGFGSDGAETIGSICASFESVTIRSKIITRLRKALNRSSMKATSDLADNIVWNEICVLLKICLAISFDCRVQAQMFLPELFHIITMVVNCGGMQVKSTVHSLLVNSVHSIATSFPLDEVNLQKLKDILNGLNEPKMCLLFGLNRPTARDSIKLEGRASESHSISTTMEQITMMLLDTIKVAAPTTDMANIWRARWMSLVASTAFQSNPAIQPRAFAVMGCLAREDVDDDLLYQVLVVLRSALSRLINQHEEEMLTSIISSLTKMMDNLRKDSRYLHQLFWIAISLVRLGSGNIFICSAALLEATLRTLSSCEVFQNNQMVPVLIRGKASIGEPAVLIDELYGIRFDEENFHFALAATLTKGLQASATKPAAIKTLTAFVEIGMTNAICPGSSPHHDIDIPLPPYLSMVMSRANNSSEIKQLLWMVGLPIEDSELGDRDMWSSIPAIEGMSDRNLLLSGILAMIDFKSCEEGIQRHALVFFTHMARRRPEVFIILYDHLVDYLDTVLNSSHNTVLLREANMLMCAVSLNPIFLHRENQRDKLEAFLHDSGLSGVWTSTSFRSTETREGACATLTDRLIETVING